MTAHQIIAKARKLPEASPAALKLTHLLNDSSFDFEEATAIIKADGVLTAKLLRVCNSSAFGLAERVGSVDHALMLLGFNEVRRLVLSLGLGNSMTVALPHYAMEANQLWHHAFMTAIASEQIVSRGFCREMDSSVAFTAGLLHDIGKPVMAQVIPDVAHSAINMHMEGEGLDSVEAEREVLGTDHAEVGACLLHIWRLPENIVEAVANHHQPVIRPTPRLSAIAHVASRVAHLADSNSERYRFRREEEIAQIFELNDRDLGSLTAEVQKSSERARELHSVI